MPYKFGEYVSTYVDPQSVKISETLRNRFMQNFQANDQLALAVDQMQAALPFENDVRRKQELQRDVENKLSTLAEQGDYENLGFAVHGTAKSFAKDYAPIQENYKRYSQYVNDFSESLKKGDYNPEQQKYLSQYMLKGANGPYKGYEIDPETGKVKEGSLFTGPTIYKDPKIMDRVTERLKILHEQKTGSTVQKVGQGPGGSLVIESGGTTSIIDPVQVQQVVDAVMAEPDVKAYVDQLSDMKTYSFQASGQLPQVFNAQLEGYTNAVQKINEALDGGGLSSADRAALKGQLTTYTQELNKLKEASQDENLMYSYVKSKAQDEIVDPVRQFASLKGGIYEKTSVYKESYDALWMDEYKRKKDFEEEYGVPMEEMSSVNATMYGKTIEEQQTTAGNYIASAEALENEAKDYTLSQTVRQQKLQQAQALRNKAGIINQNIAKAGDMSYSIAELDKADPYIMTVLKEMYPGKTAGEYGLLLNRTFDNPKDQDYKDFEQAWNKKSASGWKQNLSDGVNEINESANFERYLGMKYGAFGSSDNYAEAVFRTGDRENLIQTGDDDGSYRYTDVLAGMDAIRGAFERTKASDVNDKLREIKISNPLQYGVLPGLTDEESRQNTKAADAYFKNKPLPANLTVVDEQTGKTLSGAELNAYNTSTYAYDPIFKDWVLVLQGDAAKLGNDARKTVRLSGDQVSNSVLQRYQNSPKNIFASEIVAADPGEKGQVVKLEKNLLDENGDRTGEKIIVNLHSQGAGSQPLLSFTWLNADGTVATYTDPKTKKEVEYRTEQMYATEPKVSSIVGSIHINTNVPKIEW